MGVPIHLRPIKLCEGMGWTEKALRARHAQGERAFARGFFLNAIADGELSFPGYPKCRVPGVTIGDIARSDWFKVTGVDLSGSKRPGNAIVTVAVDPLSHRRYVIDVRYGAWRSNETCEQIGIVDSHFRPSLIMVEDNGYQQALIDWAQADKSKHRWWMKVEATTTGSNKRNQEIGLPALQVEFERGGWVFPLSEWEGANQNDDGPRGWWARLDQEMRHHPVAEQSDGTMALWFARQGIVMHGGLDVPTNLGDFNAR